MLTDWTQVVINETSPADMQRDHENKWSQLFYWGDEEVRISRAYNMWSLYRPNARGKALVTCTANSWQEARERLAEGLYQIQLHERG